MISRAALVATSLAAAAHAGPLRVAVAELGCEGLPARSCAILAAAIEEEAGKYATLQVVGPETTRTLLEAEQVRDCEHDPVCLTHVLGTAALDVLVAGRVGRVGESTMIALKRIDLRRAAVEQSASRRLVGDDGSGALAVVDRLVLELFPEAELRAGEVPGVDPRFAHYLDPPPVPRWAFWTSSAGTLVLAGIGAAFALQAQDAADEHQRLLASSLPPAPPVSASDVLAAETRANAAAQRANVSFAGAGAALVLTGVLAFFTDWRGYRDWDPSAPAGR